MKIQIKEILVTGAAGFIGFHLCKRLLDQGYKVLGLDNINDYYSISLKYDRLSELGVCTNKTSAYNEYIKSTTYKNFTFIKLNLEDRKLLPEVFDKYKFDVVCNFAAQAGVRHSSENPEAYVDSNLVGFLNILECCRKFNVNHFVYASSSSVYGMNRNIPFLIDDQVDHPISFYAATKKSNELMAHSYSYLYGIQTIGLRFFTVYGPWGRPDMAIYLFTDAIAKGKSINVYNDGNMERDFTFIDDAISVVARIISFSASDENYSDYRLYNVGSGSNVGLMDCVHEIEKNMGIKAKKKMTPIPRGDMKRTLADLTSITADYGYKPLTSMQEGIRKFVDWYNQYHHFN